MLTVAVTGSTGEIGKPFVSALERAPEVERVIGMARRPFDPAAHGWEKFEYQRGDILDPRLGRGAGRGRRRRRPPRLRDRRRRRREPRDQPDRSRNVFRAAVEAGAKRLVYTSSVAAYGFDGDLPELLTEDMPGGGPRATPIPPTRPRSRTVLAEELAGSQTDAYVFRPCIVAGPQATMLLDIVPLLAISRRIPGPLHWALRRVPELRPVLPDPGVPFQLVHQDDVADALAAR